MYVELVSLIDSNIFSSRLLFDMKKTVMYDRITVDSSKTSWLNTAKNAKEKPISKTIHRRKKNIKSKDAEMRIS